MWFLWERTEVTDCVTAGRTAVSNVQNWSEVAEAEGVVLSR